MESFQIHFPVKRKHLNNRNESQENRILIHPIYRAIRSIALFQFKIDWKYEISTKFSYTKASFKPAGYQLELERMGPQKHA